MSEKRKSVSEMLGDMLREGSLLYFTFALLEGKIKNPGCFASVAEWNLAACSDNCIGIFTAVVCGMVWAVGMITERRRTDG